MSKTIVPGLPAEGFVRMQQIVGDPGVSEEQAAKLSTPEKPVAPRAPQPGVLPVTEQHLRSMIRAGLFPAPVKMGPKVALFRVEEVRAWLASTSAKASASAEGASSEAPRRRRRRGE
jgi:prophage regulatory protein